MVSLEPNLVVEAPPGAEFEQTVVIHHDGGTAMRGGTIDFHPATGELGLAALTYRGGDEFYETETVVTVASSGGDGEELPDTGTPSTTVALLALGVMAAGAGVLAPRARRA